MKTTKAARESSRILREALAPYLDIPHLRRLAAQGDDLRAALNDGVEPPDEVLALIDTHPSPEDILITRQIVEAGKLLECEVLDHLILGQGRWVSLREKGLGFDKK